MAEETTPKKSKGGRPKGDPNAVRVYRVNARFSQDEYTALKAKAAEMGMTPARWVHEATLSRRLPSPPIPAINQEAYYNFVRLSSNLNQLSKAVNSGKAVTVDIELLYRLIATANAIGPALIGVSK